MFYNLIFVFNQNNIILVSLKIVMKVDDDKATLTGSKYMLSILIIFIIK